jgi:cobalt-zinc-cadmium efflux system outer membrane protein
MARMAPLLIIIIFNGCTIFHPKPLSPAQTASQFESRSLDNPELKNYMEKILNQKISIWPLPQWNFRMLALASSFYNQNLEIVKAHWEVTKAGIVTAEARPNPSINLTPQFSTNVLGELLSPWIVASEIEIPIQTAGKRRFKTNEAKQLSDAARLNIISTAWQEWTNLKKSLLDLYNTNLKDSIVHCQFKLENEIIKLLERRLSVGEISSLDFTQGLSYYYLANYTAGLAPGISVQLQYLHIDKSQI